MALIFTIKGDLEESTLIKTTGYSESETESVTWEQWELDGEVVKRNVHMHLKQGIELVAEASL